MRGGKMEVVFSGDRQAVMLISGDQIV